MVHDMDAPTHIEDEKARMDLFVPSYSTPQDAYFASPYTSYSRIVSPSDQKSTTATSKTDFKDPYLMKQA